MPPKRKNNDTAVGDAQAGAKAAKTATTAPKENKDKKPHKPKPTKAQKAIKQQAKAAAAEAEAKASLEDDEDFDKEQIGPNGISKLCEDIEVSLETVDMLVLAYHLEADTMPIFTKDEWAKGMKKLEIDSIERLKAKLPGLVEKLKEPAHFKEFYRYIFMFSKDSEQKCMPVEAKKPVKVINKDQWYNFLDFSDTISEDLSNYDGLSSAWPVLLDEYVEWRNEESA
ncbi:DCN1-like protein 5 [Mortierella sp. GBA35]|nr:DCN1-like protein 5 [Mortierella sp. GBA35]